MNCQSTLKQAVKEWISIIKKRQVQFKNEDYYYIPEQKQYDEGYIEGMIAAKIWFEKYEKRVKYQKDEDY